MAPKIRPPGEPAAGNGLLSRRALIEGAMVAGAAGAGLTNAWGEPLKVQPWMTAPGGNFVAYGQPSHFESKVARNWAAPANPATLGIGSARTPHQFLDGMMTPSGLHFER